MCSEKRLISKSGGPPLTSNEWMLRYLYIPYTWLVFIPLVGFFTALGGILGLAASHVSLRPMDFIGIAWGRILCWCNFTRISLVGLENLDPTRSYVIMCNHQSHFDILAMYGYWPQPFKWVMKQELRRIPLLGAFCERAKHVYVDRRNREKAIASLNAAKAWIKDGTSILFFPEGTRSRDGRVQPFKKGGFVMALDMGLPILPVSISGTHRVLPGKQLWLFPGKGTIRVHKPIDVTQYSQESREQLMADVRKVIREGLTDWEKGEE